MSSSTSIALITGTTGSGCGMSWVETYGAQTREKRLERVRSLDHAGR
jgi:hypothetical protein